VNDREPPSGGAAHELTTEDRRTGAKRTNEINPGHDVAAQTPRAKLEGAVDRAAATLVAELSAERVRASCAPVRASVRRFPPDLSGENLRAAVVVKVLLRRHFRPR